MGRTRVQGVESPVGRFTGVEGDQRRWRSSGGVGERVGGMESCWKRECSSDGAVQGAKAGLTASKLLK